METKILITHPDITPDMERIRSGDSQLFRKLPKNNREFINKDNADVILVPPSRELYAELIDEKWYWVSGCAECNGKPRDWMSYIECDKHNVCVTCGCSRAQLTEAPWGGKHGWQCKPCAESERRILASEKLAKVADEEYDPWDYRCTDNIKCPHCGNEYEPDCLYEDTNETCEVCKGNYEIIVNHEISYSTEVIGERVK